MMVKILGVMLALTSLAGTAGASIVLAPMSAPEIDPSSAMVGLSMLAGGLAVLRGRKGKDAAK